MGRLIGYELRKAFMKKSMLIMLVLAIAVVIYTNWTAVEQGYSGYAKIYKEAFQRYEGQTVTEVFLKKAKADYQEQLLLYCDGRDPLKEGPLTPISGALVESYINQILNMKTVEQDEARYEQYRKLLETGLDINDKPLTDTTRAKLQRELTIPPGDVVYDVAGFSMLLGQLRWTHTGSSMQGLMLLVLMVLGLSSLFNREYTCNMAPVLLTVKQRSQMVWAKVLAGLLMTGIFFVATFGVVFIIVGCSYGYNGFFAPSLQLEAYVFNNIPFPDAIVGVNVLFDGLMLLLSVLSSALFIMAISASFRSTLPVLGIVIFVFVGQELFIFMFSLSNTNIPDFLNPLQQLRDENAIHHIGYATDLPVRIIMDSFTKFHPAYMTGHVNPKAPDVLQEYKFIILFNTALSLSFLVWIPWIFQRGQGPLWNRRIKKA